MIRTSSLLLLALSVAVPAVAVPTDAYAETKKQKKEREKKEKEEAEAKAAAEAEAAAAEAAAAEKAAAEAAAAPPEATVEAGASAEVTAPVVEAPAATSGAWSQRFIDRPLNLLAGMIRVDAGLGIAKIAGTPAMGMIPATDGATVVGLNVGAGYGISDKLEAGVSYGITLKEFEAKGPLRLYGLLGLAHSEKMRLSAGASFGYNLASEKLSIGAGLAFQYHLNDKMMVFMPPTHLSIGLDPTVASLGLPVGFGFQVNDAIFAAVETSLFDIGLKPSGSAFIFADRTPLTVTASFSPSNKMDLGASIGAVNAPDIADLFVVSVFARLYLGNVPTRADAAAAVVTDPTTDAPPPTDPAAPSE